MAIARVLHRLTAGSDACSHTQTPSATPSPPDSSGHAEAVDVYADTQQIRPVPSQPFASASGHASDTQQIRPVPSQPFASGNGHASSADASLLDIDTAATSPACPEARNAAPIEQAQHRSAVSAPRLGRAKDGPEVSVASKPSHREADAPYREPRMFAPRKRMPIAARGARDKWLVALRPWQPRDRRCASAIADALAACPEGPGFRLRRRPSSIEHEKAGMGVWLEGRCDMGALVGLQPGVCYPEVYHECAPSAFVFIGGNCLAESSVDLE
jgi:hypothetical protein